MLVEELIKQIEERTGKPFDAKNRKHLFSLNEKIKHHFEDDLRILNLIKKSINSTNNEESIYNSKMQYTQNRFRDQ